MLQNSLRTIEITPVVHGSRAAINKAEAPLLQLSDFIVVQYGRNDKVQSKSPNAEITPNVAPAAKLSCRRRLGNSRARCFDTRRSRTRAC